MTELRQSTAVTIKLGPFVDSSDGDSLETGLAGSMTVQVAKNGGDFANRNSSGSITYDAHGFYNVPLDATDTGSLGRLVVAVSDPGTHLVVWREFEVVAQNYYDSKYGSDKLEVDVTHWDGSGVQSPLNPGVPHVDLVYIAGDSISTSLAQLGVNVVEWAGNSVSVGGSSGHPIVDAHAISDSTTAADNVEANIGNLDAAVSSRSSHSAADVWSVGTRTLTGAENITSTGGTITVDADGKVYLGDGAHGGSSATLTLSDYSNFRATGFSTHSAADVWTVGTRTLTGADNITSSGGTIAVDGSGYVTAAALGSQAKTDVNAEVADVIRTDTVSLPGQEAPPGSPTIEECLAYLYKGWRNKLEVTSTTAKLYNDDGSTVDQKWPLGDDDSTFTKGEVVSGP